MTPNGFLIQDLTIEDPTIKQFLPKANYRGVHRYAQDPLTDNSLYRDPAVRTAYGNLACFVCIFCNVLLFAGKFLVGTIFGSMAITADAMNNLSDAGSNVVSLVGFKLAGVLGAVTAIIATIIPPFLIITVISYFYELFRDNYIVSSVLSGMQAGVGAVIASVVLDMGGGVLKQKSVLSTVVMLTAFIATYVYKVNAVYIILACIAIGVVRTVVQQRRNAQ